MKDLAMEVELSLTLSRHIAARPEQVYQAWLQPETLMRFMLNCHGITLHRVETDPRVGGTFLIEMAGTGNPPMPHTGTYLALDPYRHMAFTWVSPFSTAEASTVTLDFTPEGDGTLVTLTHRRFANPQNRDGHLAGWTMILDALMATSL